MARRTEASRRARVRLKTVLSQRSSAWRRAAKATATKNTKPSRLAMEKRRCLMADSWGWEDAELSLLAILYLSDWPFNGPQRDEARLREALTWTLQLRADRSTVCWPLILDVAVSTE